jgi:transketolase
VALIDCNGIQADGPVVLDMEPIAAKWRAFGWDVSEIDGNDMDAVVGALMLARSANGRPKAIVLRTTPGKGVARIEASEKAHFFRIDVAEWDGIIAEFERTTGAAP